MLGLAGAEKIVIYFAHLSVSDTEELESRA